MGRDKALLPLPDGRLLWQRQLDVLRGLDPAELFISGFSRPGFPADVRALGDAAPGLGPLGGIATALEVICSPRLLVLAVDLPMMTSEFLSGLLRQGDSGTKGAIPQAADGFFEPLAAVYPRSALAAAKACIERHELSLQPFVRALVADRQAVGSPFGPGEVALFTNWNSPGDLAG